ncbi:MAG: hypothetical protein M0Q49_11045 [Porticoccaceae bacterium]|nr:hypothetical protein [Porticoccaceae bacterium]
MTAERAGNGAETRAASETGTPEIYIAIDAQGISRASLEAAVMVAEQVQAGLLGLFMEDLLLQSVAELPFTTEVVRSTGEERDLFADHLRLRHRQLLDRMRLLFDECALARQVRFRFEVSERKLPIAAPPGQASGIYVPGRRRSGVSQRAGAALSRIKVLYDGSEQSLRAFDLVLSLASAGRCREVMVVNLQSLPARLLTELSQRGVRVYLLNEAPTQQAVLRHIVDGPVADLVLVPLVLAAGVDQTVLQASLENSTSVGTLLVA